MSSFVLPPRISSKLDKMFKDFGSQEICTVGDPKSDTCILSYAKHKLGKLNIKDNTGMTIIRDRSISTFSNQTTF